MRKAKLYLGLILAVTLFASAVPAGASHPALITMYGGGTGDVNWTEEWLAIGTSTCNRAKPGQQSTDILVPCNFSMWIDVGAINGVGPDCENFSGSGGYGRYTDNAGTVAGLSNIRFTVTAPRIPAVMSDEYLVMLHGNYTKDGHTRPFVGEMWWRMEPCHGQSQQTFSPIVHLSFL